jgi:hypothetical protein
MRSIAVPLELTVRLVVDAKTVDLLIALFGLDGKGCIAFANFIVLFWLCGEIASCIGLFFIRIMRHARVLEATSPRFLVSLLHAFIALSISADCI